MLVNLRDSQLSERKLGLIEKNRDSLQSRDYFKFTQIFVICTPIRLEVFHNVSRTNICEKVHLGVTRASGEERTGDWKPVAASPRGPAPLK